MMRTLAVLSKRITIPRLSPTHTKSKITQWLVDEGAEVEPYQTVFIVQCSPDFLTPGFRETPDQKVTMIIENQEDGVVSKLDKDAVGKWLEVDTPIGVIDDGDDIDGDWTWQAYTHNDETESS